METEKKHDRQTFTAIFSGIREGWAKLNQDQKTDYLIQQAEQYGIREALITFTLEDIQPDLKDDHRARENINEQIKLAGGNLLYFEGSFKGDRFNYIETLEFIDRLYGEIWLLNEISKLCFSGTVSGSEKAINDFMDNISYKGDPQNVVSFIDEISGPHVEQLGGKIVIKDKDITNCARRAYAIFYFIKTEFEGETLSGHYVEKIQKAFHYKIGDNEIFSFNDIDPKIIRDRKNEIENLLNEMKRKIKK